MRLKGIVRNHRWTTGQIRGLGALWPSVERPLADTLASIGPGARCLYALYQKPSDQYKPDVIYEGIKADNPCIRCTACSSGS